MNKIIEAAQFAAKAHENQFRKYTDLPYVIHPARVAGRVSLLPNVTEDYIIAAYLHDVLEDTHISPKEIEDRFGSMVMWNVKHLTNVSKGSTLPREKRKEMDYWELSQKDRMIRNIKALDRIDNLNDMALAPSNFVKLYCKESESLLFYLGEIEQSLRDELSFTIAQLKKSRLSE